MTSAELITALQATRPVATDTLRDRVRAIATAEPVQRPSPFARLSRISLRRFALVAVPATAVVLLGTAGVVGLLDSGSGPRSRAPPRASSTPTTDARPERGVQRPHPSSRRARLPQPPMQPRPRRRPGAPRATRPS